MKVKYKGQEVKSFDYNDLGRKLAKLDGLEVFADNGAVLVVQFKDDWYHVIEKSDKSKYEFYTMYAHDRRDQWQEV